MISYAAVYGRLLSEIKFHYEQVVSVLEDGHENEVYLRGKMMEIVNTPATLSNYRRRAQDLMTKWI